MNKKIYIISGGTVFHIRPHLAICTPAYGTVGSDIYDILFQKNHKLDVISLFTKMAGGFMNHEKYSMETNEDVSRVIYDELIPDPATKIIFLPVALCDYEGTIDGTADKYGERLQSRVDTKLSISLTPAEKIIKNIRKTRKDIFVVGFKTTCGKTADEQYIAGLNLLKECSLNLVLANDIKTKVNMIITPEEARYNQTTDRIECLTNLVDMTLLRSHLTFTRSTIVAGDPVPWDSPLVPDNLRTVVDFCIARGAYKKFRGVTAGHFAVKLSPTSFLTSRRKTDFNDMKNVGLVKVETDGPDNVLAYGSKPSVGGQSQRIVFEQFPGADCIVHFHCPIKPGSQVPTVSQKEFECGSHQCGSNTARGLKRFGNLYAVYLDNHGPNIVFNKDTKTTEIIEFIQENFDLTGKTGGYVELGPILNTQTE